MCENWLSFLILVASFEDAVRHGDAGLEVGRGVDGLEFAGVDVADEDVEDGFEAVPLLAEAIVNVLRLEIGADVGALGRTSEAEARLGAAVERFVSEVVLVMTLD